MLLASVMGDSHSVAEESKQLCSLYLEDLAEDHDLGHLDACPACLILVARHPRRPVSALVGPAATAGITSAQTNSHSFSTLHNISKLTNLLPRWTRDSVCRTFLDHIHEILTPLGLPSEEWIRVLPFLMDDAFARKWVSENLIGKGLDWAEASAKFTAHFQACDYSVVLQRKYRNCKQGDKESVQAYGDRFLALAASLGISEDNPLAINQFLENLSPIIYKEYFKWLADKQFDNPDFTVTSLHKIVARCIAFDVANRTANLSSHSSSSSSSNDRPRASPKKTCQYHPNSTSHTTAECKSKGGSQSASSGLTQSHSVKAEASQSSNAQTPVKTNKTCYVCSERGHYANTCPKRQAPASSSTRPAQGLAPSTASSSSTAMVTRSMSAKAAVSASSSSNAQPTTRAVDVQPLPPASVQTVGVVANAADSEIDRAIPSSMFVPVRQVVLFVVRGHVFPTLLDTGANVSVVAQQVVKELNIGVQPVQGTVRLAHANADVQRVGTTEPLQVEALFPGPPSSAPPALTFTHTFEVMPMHTAQYSFLIGMDLIGILFPKGIPPEFYPPAISPGPVPSLHRIQVNAAAADISDTVTTQDANLVDGLAELRKHIHNEGAGETPCDEQPDRAGTFTSSSLEQEYASRRSALQSDPDIQHALHINSQITGFCSVPESVVTLVVDPEKRSSLFRRQYKIPHSLFPAAREIIQRWFEAGIITLAPPGCEFNNPLTFAPKKDADGNLTGLRVCLDTRALNSALLATDKFQLPHIPDVLDIFAGRTIFGEFDCEEAYLHFQLHPDSQPLTAFTFDGTQYMFRGCPFGLSLLPSHFQRIMSLIFRDLPFTFPYLDNLPFGSTSWDEHRDHILAIILRCSQVNMKIKPSSVKFGQSHLKCLGHLISVDGVGIAPAKLQAIHDWELPTTGKELQRFLGFVTFIRRYVRHFADLTGALEAVKNQNTIQWTDELRECFETIKEAVARAPFLQFPQWSLPFHIATDASNVGCGGVLYQPRSEGEGITDKNIVAICSKKWNQSQLNYPAYKKELFGIVYSLRQFHPFVWGRRDLVIFTDHKPLTHMLEQKELSVALQQWLDVLLCYKFEIRYRPGILNVLPDALSRMYSASYPYAWGIPLPADPAAAAASITSALPSRTLASNSELDSESVAVSLPSPSVSFVFVGEGIAIASVDLEVEMEKRGLKAPPVSERVDAIQRAHLFGHFGRESVYKSLLAQGLWWPNMRQQIQEQLANCDPCNRFTVVKAGFHPARFITADGPWDHLQIDTSVHLPASPDGFTTLLVVIDVFTGFILLRAVKTSSAEIVAHELWDIFSTFGLPKIIQSDNGPEFTNDVLRALVKVTGIDHRLISPYNPRADGKVERSIGTVMSTIKKLLHGTSTHWPLFVPFAQLSFNHKIASLTGSSPFSLMFGRQLNEMTDYTAHEPHPVSLDDWKAQQEKILSLIYPAISERIRLSKSKMIQSLNKHRRVLLHSAFPPGAVVMLKDPHRQNKFEPTYIGPYTIVRRTRNGAYSLRDATGELLDRHVPPDQLKLVSRKARPVDLENNVYEVEKILAHRGSPGQYEYETKWKNYRETTWEPSSSFHDTALIRDYWHAHNDSSGSSSTS